MGQTGDLELCNIHWLLIVLTAGPRRCPRDGHNHPSYDLGLILGSGIAGFGIAFVGMNAIYYVNDVLKF
jgi:hypothetical protein